MGTPTHHGGISLSPHEHLHEVTRPLREQREEGEAVKHQSKLASGSATEPGQEEFSAGTSCPAGFH